MHVAACLWRGTSIPREKIAGKISWRFLVPSLGISFLVGNVALAKALQLLRALPWKAPVRKLSANKLSPSNVHEDSRSLKPVPASFVRFLGVLFLNSFCFIICQFKLPDSVVFSSAYLIKPSSILQYSSIPGCRIFYLTFIWTKALQKKKRNKAIYARLKLLLTKSLKCWASFAFSESLCV